jgi:CRP-like cAMP-binding protein
MENLIDSYTIRASNTGDGETEKLMAVSDILLLLKKSRLFQGLHDHEIDQICEYAMLSERAYEKDKIIINQGEQVRKIGIIKSGSIIGVKYHYNGDSQIMRIYNQGEVFSLDAVNTTFLSSPVTLISQTDCAIIFLSYKFIFETNKISPAVKERVLFNSSVILSNELIRMMYKIDVLSKRTLRERILTYLSIMKEKKGDPFIDIGMNQEEFAQYLCVNRSALSTELNQMRKTGLIDYNKNRYILIKETDALKQKK